MFYNNSKIENIFLIALLLLIFQFNLCAQPRFVKNNGQFNKSVQFQIKMNAGGIFFEKSKVIYNLIQKDVIHDKRHGDAKGKNVLGHIYQTTFLNSNPLITKVIGDNKNVKLFQENMKT